MAHQNLSSQNIDDFDGFDFRTLKEDEEIVISEQNYRSFPLSIITQTNGTLNVNVILEVFLWDYWLRNYSINRFKSAFENSFRDLSIDGISEVTFQEVIEEDDNKSLLLCWNMKFPTPHWYKEIKTKILTSVDVILYKTRINLEENVTTSSAKGLKKFFLISGSAYHIGVGTFWMVLPLICGFSFFMGTIKYDTEKISLAEDRKALQDTVSLQENTIKYLRHNSDSALNILGHMPYNEMNLDQASFRKVQTTIENAGAVLHLNK